MSELPILTFHSLDDSGSVISFPPRRFRRLMESLAAAGWRGAALGPLLDDRSEVPTAGDSGPLRTFAITFDDAYRNVSDVALPCLRELGFSATVFAVAGRLGGDNRWSGRADPGIPTLELTDADELRALRDAGWEVGSHGLSHVPLTGLEPDRLAGELGRSRELLERATGAPVRLLAYPYGEHDEQVRKAAAARYEAAVTTRLAVARPDLNASRHRLPRIDTYYLRPPLAPRFTSHTGRLYLRARALGRRLRGGD